MPKNTTVNVRVDSEIKEQAGEILESLGMSLSQAFNLMLYQIKSVRGLPFEVKQRLPIELNDGHGSYICEFGYVHDYSNFDFDAIENETAEMIGPFDTFEEYKRSLYEEEDDE
ncbi:MAG: type II toxin-antitoxin system RelB/DinJ family antitoxin [Oscillospiraceae bacterium]|nr:type II toxin-antitoxin system RelB/DinJ family antitoxin [Oscillospiraceae bacterium]